MKLIMCGTMVPSEYENRIQYLSNAANRFQLNFVKEMKKECEIDVYSYLGITVDQQIQTELSQETGDVKSYFRTADRLAGVIKYKHAVKQALKKADCLLTYNVTYAWMFAPELARRLGKKSALILADYSGEESYHSFARRLYARLQLKVIQKYDVVIGLSETTKRYLKSNQRFLCVEGGIDQDVYDYFGQSSDDEQQHENGITTYMYAGILEPVTGKPIISTRFPGWEKYNEHIAFCESTVDGLQTALQASNQRRKTAIVQRKFAAGFLWSNQVKKIQSMLTEKS